MPQTTSSAVPPPPDDDWQGRALSNINASALDALRAMYAESQAALASARAEARAEFEAAGITAMETLHAAEQELADERIALQRAESEAASARAERDAAAECAAKREEQILRDGLCSVCQGHGTMGTGVPLPEGGEEVGPCDVCRGSGSAAMEAAVLREALASMRGERDHWKETALTVQRNLTASHEQEKRSEWLRGHSEAFDDACTALESRAAAAESARDRALEALRGAERTVIDARRDLECYGGGEHAQMGAIASRKLGELLTRLRRVLAGEGT